MKPSILIALLLFCSACCISAGAQNADPVTYNGVKFLAVHRVLSVTDLGTTVMLEDSSLWTVCPFCRSTVARWLPGETILIGERGDSYRYSYYLSRESTGRVSYPAYAMCVKD